MKKAFTLAEVLITLGIIGVVAALTLPSLMTDIGNKKLKTQFFKTYTDLNQAAKLFYTKPMPLGKLSLVQPYSHN